MRKQGGAREEDPVQETQELQKEIAEVNKELEHSKGENKTKKPSATLILILRRSIVMATVPDLGSKAISIGCWML